MRLPGRLPAAVRAREQAIRAPSTDADMPGLLLDRPALRPAAQSPDTAHTSGGLAPRVGGPCVLILGGKGAVEMTRRRTIHGTDEKSGKFQKNQRTG